MNSRSSPKKRQVALLIWIGLALVMIGPIVIAATSPYLAYRTAVHIAGGLAGIIGMALLLVQPLLAAGWLPGVGLPRLRTLHRWVGIAIVVAVLLHVGFLYLTSPLDTMDALLFVAPAPFSVFGVTSMWVIVLTVLLSITRRILKLPYGTWRLIHSVLAAIVAATTAMHAFLIQGTMGPNSKLIVILVMLITVTLAAIELNLLRPYRQRRALTKAS
ncbi:ferric reductase-like transmembrane domain-containing protein [Rhizobium pusense]|uniref:ferric reductase-like transmembrane domain-containing protein n=1 Tax=Agrobacterium pusense TaxID=648995 RepID=UPI001C6EFF30|nr:ferric reductase-like transmembrane domain-containing protein [Agrobacterium pusense]MBW9080720.1 ferric reductase-like transmembrane domain-containing protein [Agrobacterium pusense]